MKGPGAGPISDTKRDHCDGDGERGGEARDGLRVHYKHGSFSIQNMGSPGRVVSRGMTPPDAFPNDDFGCYVASEWEQTGGRKDGDQNIVVLRREAMHLGPGWW